MTAVFCPALSDSAGRRVVNHRILGTGQRERERLLSATLPAIREPALAHGRGHTRERRQRGAALHATANVTRSPAPPAHGHRHTAPAAPAERAAAAAGAGREGKPRSVPSCAAAEPRSPPRARRRAPGDARSRHAPGQLQRRTKAAGLTPQHSWASIYFISIFKGDSKKTFVAPSQCGTRR